MAEIIGPIIGLAIDEASCKGGLRVCTQIVFPKRIQNTKCLCSRIIKIIRSFN